MRLRTAERPAGLHTARRSRLDAAVATIRKGALSDPAERSKVRKLTAELDEIAWDMQDQAEQGILPRQAYHEAFARAQAAAAVGSRWSLMHYMRHVNPPMRPGPRSPILMPFAWR